MSVSGHANPFSKDCGETVRPRHLTLQQIPQRKRPNTPRDLNTQETTTAVEDSSNLFQPSLQHFASSWSFWKSPSLQTSRIGFSRCIAFATSDTRHLKNRQAPSMYPCLLVCLKVPFAALRNSSQSPIGQVHVLGQEGRVPADLADAPGLGLSWQRM